MNRGKSAHPLKRSATAHRDFGAPGNSPGRPRKLSAVQRSIDVARHGNPGAKRPVHPYRLSGTEDGLEYRDIFDDSRDPCFSNIDLGNNSTFLDPKKAAQNDRSKELLDTAKSMRAAVLARLDREEEEGHNREAWAEIEKAVAKFRKCGSPLKLRCQTCNHIHLAEERCKRKWCPVCSRVIAADRAQKYMRGVDQMQWPLFVTLTMPNVENLADDLNGDAVRKLRRAFGKLRHRKLWTAHVKGGVAAIEVTNIGNGWHPHLHAILDCEWLAFQTPIPRKGASASSIKASCKAANTELGKAWAQILGVKSDRKDWEGTVFKVKRTTGATVVSEVLKYSVKGGDLATCEEDIAPLIRCLDKCRLVTSFGTLFGKLSDLEEDDEAVNAPLECPDCGDSCWIPDSSLDSFLKQEPRRVTEARKIARRMACGHK